ncbi:MAG TPA: hypothetical protein VEZ11_11530 [Thermoanaerobaculia bacterium]|nr:hypothetical protein [Thermoanaerobaculia bacterium]
MTDAAPPSNPPMGHLDAIEAGSKRITVQTEFLYRPTWRVETKIYVAGEVKKLYTVDLSATPEDQLQRVVSEFHQAKYDEIVTGLRKKVE